LTLLVLGFSLLRFTGNDAVGPFLLEIRIADPLDADRTVRTRLQDHLRRINREVLLVVSNCLAAVDVDFAVGNANLDRRRCSGVVLDQKKLIGLRPGRLELGTKRREAKRAGIARGEREQRSDQEEGWDAPHDRLLFRMIDRNPAAERPVKSRPHASAYFAAMVKTSVSS